MKYKKLILGIILDVIGYLSYLIPGLGETIDFVWAPITAFLMVKLYVGTAGKTAALLSFIEEALPGTDFIPSFTIMWIYTYLISSNATHKKEISDPKK